MTEVQIQGVALVSSLVAMPLVSWGSSSDGPTAVLIIGGLLLAASLVTLTSLRYVNPQEEQ